MQRKLLKTALLTVCGIAMFMPSCFAATSAINVSSNKTEVKAGETVEVYVDLGIESIGYDLKINENDSSLIKEKSMKSDVGKGKNERIYLVQVEAEEDRTVHQPGTRLAKFQYTVKDDIKENKTLEVTVSGDVAGKNSSEKNTVSEKVSIAVSPKAESQNEQQQEQPKQETQQEQPQQQTTGTVQEDILEEPKTVVRIGDDGLVDKGSEQGKKSDSQSPNKLPATGTNKVAIICIISGLIIIQGVIYIAYRKTKVK